MKMITPKTTREIAIADTIWDAFEMMASDMGSDRDSLVNQAMFMFARLNGYLTVSQTVAQMPSGVPLMPTMVPATSAKVLTSPLPPPPAMPAPHRTSEIVNEKTPEPPKSEESDFADDFDKEFEAEAAGAVDSALVSADKESAAAEEDDFLKEEDNQTPLPPPPPPSRRAGFSSSRRSGSTLPPPRRSRLAKPEPAREPAEEPASDQFDAPPEEEDDRRAVAEKVLETAAELERLIKGGNSETPEVSEEEEDEAKFEEKPARRQASSRRAAPEMYITNSQGETKAIGSGPFIIGRGKNCDMVINSGKVSREHAIITCEDGVYFIEDQNSSNGTWFHKQRIKKQQIEDGDEFFICSEKVRFSMS